MRVLITGAEGFVGRQLALRLLGDANGLDSPLEELALLDVRSSREYPDARVRRVTGDLADAEVVREALASEPNLVFHLACVPGVTAEREYDRGRHVNLFGTIALVDGLRKQRQAAGLVFSSSAAVFGAPLPIAVDDWTLPRPSISYGSQKLIAETLIEDYSRRGWLRGLSLRLSGILARPEGSVANLSAFLNDVMHAARRGSPYVLPLGAEAATWLMSVPRCVDNLVHAADVVGRLTGRRTWMLPALRVSMTSLVQGLSQVFGPKVQSLITFAPNPELEAIFGQPELTTSGAEELGFYNDGDVVSLVRRAMSVAAD